MLCVCTTVEGRILFGPFIMISCHCLLACGWLFWHRHKKNGSLLSGLLFLDRKCQHCTPMFCTVTWGKTSAQWNPIVIVLFGFVFSNIEKKEDKTVGIRPKWLILTLRMILCGNIEFLILIHSVLGKLKSNNFWIFF